MSREQQAVVHEPRPFSELRETGLLWLINRQVLHPRGWALALHFDDETGEATGWSLMGDGIEPWNFPDGTENEHLANINRLLAPLELVAYPDNERWLNADGIPRFPDPGSLAAVLLGSDQ